MKNRRARAYRLLLICMTGACGAETDAVRDDVPASAEVPEVSRSVPTPAPPPTTAPIAEATPPAAPAQAAPPPAVAALPDDYVRTSCGFAFRAPPGLVEVPVQGIDSCVNRFRFASCELASDAGWYSAGLDDLGGSVQHRRTISAIDGKQAAIVSLGPTSDDRPYFAGVHFPHVSFSISPVMLTMTARCATVADRDAASTLFETIRFLPDW